ncbi:palmitoyl protein thioesterase [Chloropicon primus]|uniref:Palmitoyl-protein thioesterase 1 n=1 Tax=Chloropicon primus TaxID=1764295 RepID=A0A5B8MPS8_9CHLO|nr:palmitoyl protein thioesterase [Chloropicon primus]UPR01707.1 palmitoyl protein thioesterase [Chloropicon primus]|eukprot:QDZ22486.1 palmitoyl protein thioesterase [Chloropicon primus]
MGDSCCNEHSMGRVKHLIETELGVDVYSVQLAEKEDEDRDAGFFGNVNDQVAKVCEIIASDARLSKGYNAIGFSQGGQFLRAVVEVCPTLEPSMPKCSKLITFGGQHQGVMDWPGCGKDVSDLFCRSFEAMLGWGAYSDFLRQRVVQAQYFKDPLKMETYLKKNIFLPGINNEVHRNPQYKENLASLDLLLLYMWKGDTTVVPKESSLFGVYNATTKKVTPLKEQAFYREDWIGLRELDEQGKLLLDVIEGNHMEIDWDFFNSTIVHGFLS